ncbi:MAG TPA: hypothetical protein VNO86_03180 [Candidatus Binatia bacterium]|nr:hypothetical protein [Candidatus Binatia bacterium]
MPDSPPPSDRDAGALISAGARAAARARWHPEADVDRSLLSEAGRLLARRQWGPPRRLRLDDLSPQARDEILRIAEEDRRRRAEEAGR